MTVPLQCEIYADVYRWPLSQAPVRMTRKPLFLSSFDAVVIGSVRGSSEDSEHPRGS